MRVRGCEVEERRTEADERTGANGECQMQRAVHVIYVDFCGSLFDAPFICLIHSVHWARDAHI